jgi:predicted PolB exonuclease-like 3'-5' exonuclease
MTHHVVFDLETAPDIETARRLLNLGSDVADDSVREAIVQQYSRDGQPPLGVAIGGPQARR